MNRYMRPLVELEGIINAAYRYFKPGHIKLAVIDRRPVTMSEPKGVMKHSQLADTFDMLIDQLSVMRQDQQKILNHPSGNRTQEAR